jgi:hypothetical protein
MFVCVVQSSLLHYFVLVLAVLDLLVDTFLTVFRIALDSVFCLLVRLSDFMFDSEKIG